MHPECNPSDVRKVGVQARASMLSEAHLVTTYRQRDDDGAAADYIAMASEPCIHGAITADRAGTEEGDSISIIESAAANADCGGLP